MSLRIQVARSREALAALVPAWEELAAEAVEANPFYEPWILLPALRAEGEGEGFRCVLVWDGKRLIGLFPFERRRGFKGLPVTTLTSWRHSAYLLCTPLVRAGAAVECLEALLQWVETDNEGASIVQFRYVPCDGAFHSVLADTLRASRTTVAVTDSHTRALLRKGASAEGYMEAAMSAQLRKQLRRKERRLSERSRFSWVALAPGQEMASDIEQFLALEASGWKGLAGSALASTEAGLRFGREVLGEAARRGRLQMLGIDCDGRPVARRCSLLAGDGSYAFKTAYDETYADYSPGVLAHVLNLREFHRLDGVRWMDSYTDPENPTVNRMWKDRRAIQSLAVGVGAWGELWVSLLPLLRWTARRFRGKAQTAARDRLAA